MEKELYYAVLFTPKVNMNEIKIDYDVLGAIPGEYDQEKRIFISKHTGEEYEMLDSGILHLDDLADGDYSDMSEESAKIHKQGIFFAFPIKAKDFEERYNSFVKEMDETINSLEESETTPEEKNSVEKMGSLLVEMGYGYYDPEVYAACVSFFNLFSVFNTYDNCNYFYIFDGDNKSLIQIDDLGKDIDRVLDEGMIIGTEQKPPIVTIQLPILNGLVGNLFSYGNSSTLEKSKEEVETEQEEEEVSIEPFDPDELEAVVKSEVIGQDEAVNTLVTAIYNNMKYGRVFPKLKSNILIVGPAGCGKTEMVESIARHLNIPFTRFDMTTVSETGYVGNSMSQAIRDLIYAAGGDVEKAKHGILFLDEIGKIASTGGEGITTSGVQDECLSLLEGKEITIPAESFRDSSFIFDTSGLTIVCADALSHLFDTREKENNPPGFVTAPKQNIDRPVETKDIKKSGLKQELVRRLPVVITIRKLDDKDFYDIITKSKISNLVIREEAFAVVDNVKVARGDGYVEAVAEQAAKEAIGASGIQRVIDNSLKVATRKVSLLKGEGGTLLLKKETVTNPKDFELYKLNGDKVYSYTPIEEKANNVKEECVSHIKSLGVWD